MMRSKVVVVAGVLAVMLAACGGGDDGQPPLAITQANAPAVASEVLFGAGQVTSTSGGLGGGVSSSPVVVALMRPQLHDVTSVARRRPDAPLPADPVSEDCTFGGTLVTAMSSTTSAKLTYSNCSETQGAVTNGSITETAQINGSSIKVSASLDLTVTIGSITLAESGSFDLALSGGDDFSFDVTSDHLQVSVKNGTTVVDEITLSNLSLHLGSTTSGGKSVTTAHEKYDVDSSKLTGSFTVETSADLTADDDAAHAFGGSLTITGANGSSLKITIQGDETYTPATGEGQVKLEVNGQVTWTNWADLAAASSVPAP